MALSKYLEVFAPTESWWTGKDRSAFAAAAKREAPRMHQVAPYVVTTLESGSQRSQQISRPARRHKQAEGEE